MSLHAALVRFALGRSGRRRRHCWSGSRRRVCSRATPTVPDVGPLKVGWSTIYTTPSWMTETQNEIEAEIERLRSLGMEIEFQASTPTTTPQPRLPRFRR